MDTNEKVQINLQIPLSVREDFRVVARSEGQSMSALLYRYILKTIREARSAYPEIFPDYEWEKPPVIVDESKFDEMLNAAFDGKPPPVEDLEKIMKAIKEIMKVKEIS